MSSRSDSRYIARPRAWRFALHAAPLALLAAVVALAWTSSAHAQAGQTRFALNASGQGVTCDAPSEPAECQVELGAGFTLSIDLLDPPAAGYIAIQTQAYLDGLAWTPGTVEDESVWPDNNLPLRNPPDAIEQGTTTVLYGGLTATSAPFLLSHYEGPVVETHVACPSTAETFDPALIAYHPVASPNGSTVSLEDLTTVDSPTIGTAQLDIMAEGAPRTVPITNILSIRCGGAAAPPGDDIPGYDEGATIDGAQPGDTTAASTGEPGDGSATPGEVATPGPGGTTAPTAEPSANGDDNDDGGAPWAIIGVVIGAVVVAAAGGAYYWYLRRSRAST